jgi:hypothetical protein
MSTVPHTTFYREGQTEDSIFTPEQLEPITHQSTGIITQLVKVSSFRDDHTGAVFQIDGPAFGRCAVRFVAGPESEEVARATLANLIASGFPPLRSQVVA